MEPQQPSGRNQNGRAHATVRLADVDVLSSSVERVDIRASGDERRGVGAHVVEIRTQVGRQELWIDGVYQPYFVGPDGYTLQAHVYAPPERTLIAAAQAYITDQQPTKIVGPRRLPGEAADPSLGDDVDIPGSTCVRKNFVDLTADERHRFGVALNTLNERGVIAAFSKEHADNWFKVHFGSAFLPWHRHFLLRFERELQSVDSRVTLPYWDSTRADSDDIFNAPQWVSFFGDRNIQGGVLDPDDWELTRGSGGAALPTIGMVTNALGAADYPTFRGIEA